MRAQRENRVKASFGGKAPLCTSFRVYAKAGANTEVPSRCDHVAAVPWLGGLTLLAINAAVFIAKPKRELSYMM
jgi:hypothetical protein